MEIIRTNWKWLFMYQFISNLQGIAHYQGPYIHQISWRSVNNFFSYKLLNISQTIESRFIDHTVIFSWPIYEEKNSRILENWLNFYENKLKLNRSINFLVISNLKNSEKVDLSRKYWTGFNFLKWIQIYRQRQTHTRTHARTD